MSSSTLIADTEIRPSLLKAVNAYLKIAKQAESKLIALVEEAFEMLKTMNFEQVVGAFRETYAVANNMKTGDFGDDPRYAAFRMTTLRVVKVAEKGRDWFAEQSLQGLTVNAMYEFAKDSDSDSDSEPGAGLTTASKRKGKRTTDPATKLKIRGNGRWLASCRYIVSNERNTFVSMLKDVGNRIGVPEALIEEFSEYILGKR